MPIQTESDGIDFIFRVRNSAVPFKVHNLRGRSWLKDREDFLFYSLVFEAPVETAICVEILTARQVRKKCLVVRRFFVEPREGLYKREVFGEHVFWVNSTHEVHCSGSGWDRLSFGLSNKQIAWGCQKGQWREECFPQWLLTASFDEFFDEATGGRMKGLPFTPIDPLFFDPSLRKAVDVPQKTCSWYQLRDGKIGSSTAYKLTLGCFTALKHSGPVYSNRLMRGGSLVEDGFACALIVYKTAWKYEERGWLDFPGHEKWGDSVDGLITDPTMNASKIPGWVKAKWRKAGWDINKMDLTKGCLEIKCSDKDLSAGNRHYYLIQV